MTKKTITEQIASFEATRQAKSAEMDSIMEVSAEKGETLDAEQTEKYDGLVSEVKSIDDHLVRLRQHEKSNKAAAVVIENVKQLRVCIEGSRRLGQRRADRQQEPAERHWFHPLRDGPGSRQGQHHARL
jgi:hypothetical protein